MDLWIAALVGLLGYVREEDQSKYFIPMQFHIRGRVVQGRAARFAAAGAWVLVVLAVAGSIAFKFF